MDEVDYTKCVPSEPPAELIPYLQSLGKLTSEVIVYKVGYITNPLTEMREKCIECRCSACESTFIQDYIKSGVDCSHSCQSPIGFWNVELNEAVYSGGYTICPNCSAEVMAYHCSSIPRQRTLEEYYLMTVHNIGGKIALLKWYVERVAFNNGTTQDFCFAFEGAVFEEKKAVKLMGYCKSMFCVNFFGEWEQRKRFADNFGEIKAEFVLPFDPKILDNSACANSKLDLYLKANETVAPVTYLRIWQKHRNIENLIMQGAASFVNEKILKSMECAGYYGQTPRGGRDLEGINWKEKRPAQMLGLIKEEYKIFIKEKWGARKLEFYQFIKKFNTDITIHDLDQCFKADIDSVKAMIENNYPVMKSIRYLKKQKEKYPQAKVAGLNYLMDYWDIAKKVGDDIGNPEVMYPQNIVTAHDSASSRYKHKKDEIIEAKIKLRFEALSKFYGVFDGLFIRPARTQDEMVQEGAQLHHCLARYIEDYADGKTAIFFIRRLDAPEASFFTLELDEKTGTVRQNRGLRNCSRTPEVEQFEKQWLLNVKEILKGEVKHGKSNAGSKRTA